MAEKSTKRVYLFANGTADGNGQMKDLLGGKGAGLAEMMLAGLPVPPGFTITTHSCNEYYSAGKVFPAGLWDEVLAAMKTVEQATGKGFGNPENPLLVSVRSGAKFSMPGMMDTVLNLGLNDVTVQGLAKLTSNERFAQDAYRRFIQMFGRIVLGIPGEKFDHIFEHAKHHKGVHLDTDLTADDLKEIVVKFQSVVFKETGQSFPSDPYKQLELSIQAVFSSWFGKRAVDYRRVNKIPDDLGTAVNIVAMVFGNMGQDSGTGVAFTRNPSTGERLLFGEYLTNAQGEDVVAGIRTPAKIAHLQDEMPEVYAEFAKVAETLERHYKDVQDLEFTIERGKLWMLQTRNAKRTGPAAVKVAVDMVHEGILSKADAVLRVEPAQLDQLLHPRVDPEAAVSLLATGLPASPGAAVGTVVFDPDTAETRGNAGEKVILVRVETSPEDFHGMVAAQAILTARGGMTCVAGDTRILTNRGVLAAETAFGLLEQGETLRILSFDTKKMQPIWRSVIAAGCKVSEDVRTVAVSQTGQAEKNILRLTGDHKMFTINNRKLVKKRLNTVLEDGDFLTVVDQIPGLSRKPVSSSLAYLVGALLSDGHISLKPTKGQITFIQKPTEEKAEFIAAVESAFEASFGIPFTSVRSRTTESVLRGRVIRGSVEDRISSRREPAAKIAEIRDNLSTWALSLDRSALLNFLAGFVDGDGTYAVGSSAVRLQIVVSQHKVNLLEGLVVACLRLGILPQVTNNREAYLVQITERVEEILAFTHRVKAEIPVRQVGAKCFSIKALFDDIVEDVNFMGRVREGIKRNIMFGADKIRRDILPLCGDQAQADLQGLLNSSLRSYRVRQVEEPETSLVYNFEVDASDDLDKNFVVFSSRMTPILISNSHAAVVARGMGKCCVAGCGSLEIDYDARQFKVGDRVIKEGDYITLDGSTGRVIEGQVPLIEPEITGDFREFMSWADEFRTLNVRTNADTPHDSHVARGFGAEGIGLCRTEHMFFEGNRIDMVRQMIMVASEYKRLESERSLVHQEIAKETAKAGGGKDKLAELKKQQAKLDKKIVKPKQLFMGALAALLPMQREDFIGIFTAMNGLPVTIRLLDPPLHEFLPHSVEDMKLLAKKVGLTPKVVEAKIEALREANPMLGHRGCRLGLVYPEITEMQARAIFEAAAHVQQHDVKVLPEVMIPLVGDVQEFVRQEHIVRRVANEVMDATGEKFDYLVGTMIELPRAALTADRIATAAEFFSFGTNDLTQTTFGLSRDDSGTFLPFYVENKILKDDPFQVLDQEGVGQLVEIGVKKGRSARPGIKIGICGEHGGEPSSVNFCHRVGMNYVSCSPYRVPIARLAAAQAALAEKSGESQQAISRTA